MAEAEDDLDASDDGAASEFRGVLDQYHERMPQIDADALGDARDILVDKMQDPLKVLTHLLRGNPNRDTSFVNEAAQKVRDGEKTTRERVVVLLDVLKSNWPQDWIVPLLVQALRQAQPALAEEEFPPRSRVLWFCSSASHAALAAHLLEAHCKARLDGVQARDGCLFRKCDLFLDWQLELTLAFPTDERYISVAMEAAFKKVCPKASFAVMSGTCGFEVGGVEGGDTVVATAALIGRLTNDDTCVAAGYAHPDKVILDKLRVVFNNGTPEWIVEEQRIANEQLPPSINPLPCHYQSLWLCRLYSELQHTTGEEEVAEKSTWLEAVGWDVRNPCQLNAHNLAVLERELPDWASGRLSSLLLAVGSQWQIDTSSPLGLRPSEPFLNCVQRKVASLKRERGSEATTSAMCEYPTTVKDYSPGVKFGALLTVDSEKEVAACDGPHDSVIACDFHSFQFYSLCVDSLGPNVPGLVCKGVPYSVRVQDSCGADPSFTSACICIEALKLFHK